MSKSDSQSDEMEQYKTTAGVAKREADLVGDHPLKHKFGDDKERKYDAEQAGARFVDMYDDPAAAIRESLHNAETACINRAEEMLEDAGLDVPSDVLDILNKAEAELGYEAQIEVTYNEHPNATTLIIEDNGVGITPQRYDILRSIGYSENHMSGNRGGQFGIGYMSHFLLCGVNGSFRLKTNPYGDYEAYSTAEYLANFEYLPDEKESTGTRFEFATLAGAAQNIDVADAVQRYSDGMQVTVLYRDFDEKGQETGKSDEFLPTFIEDYYPDNELVVSFENEYFKAVMSPESKEIDDGIITYNVTMPIKRNTDGPSYKTNQSYNASWKWDFRGKREDGPIVQCKSDPSIEGLVPIDDTKYQTLQPRQQESHIPMSSVPDDAVRMPKPASSRDSYMSGHDDFWKHVSTKLEDEWASVAATRFEELNSWQDFVDLDDKAALMRAYNNFIGYHDDPDASDLQDKIEDTFDTVVPEDVCSQLHRMQSSVNVLKEGHSAPHTKGAQRSKKMWKLVDEYGDNVYVGKSVSKKKAEIVWGLDAAFVRTEDTDYGKYADLGWEPAKELPNRKLLSKLPNLDPDVADKWENKSMSSSSSGSSSGRSSRDPSTKRIKIRHGKRRRSKWTQKTVSDVVDALENNEPFWTKYGAEFRYLVIMDQTKDSVTASKVAREAHRNKGIAATKVPKYVFKHLKDKPNVYGNKQAAIEDNKGTTLEIDFSDENAIGGSGDVEIDSTDLTDEWLFLLVGNNTMTSFDTDKVAERLGYDVTDYKYVVMTDQNVFADHWGDNIGADVVKTSGGVVPPSFDDYENVLKGFDTLQREIALDGVDESHEHFDFLFGHYPSGTELEEALEVAEKLGMT